MGSISGRAFARALMAGDSPAATGAGATAILMLGLIGVASAYAQVATDGSVGPRVRFFRGDFEIGAELGRRAGRNLFHSFEKFSLRTGERATFSGPDQIRNVISRVTGGVRSEIDGTLRSTIPGADFYFINPAGILFGPNANLDLQGSFHVSTADELRFADGATFSATNSAASSFTVATPEAFGFLGPTPAPILVDRSALEVPRGEALSLVGGNLTIQGDNRRIESGGEAGTLRAPTGTVTLAAAAGPARLNITSGELDAEQRYDIRLRDQAHVDSSGNGGGAIQIRGGGFVATRGSLVSSDNDGPNPATGGISVDADRVILSGASQLRSDVSGSGHGGEISLKAAGVRLRGRGVITAKTIGAGDTGAITIQAGRLLIQDVFSGVANNTEFGSGNAGAVQIVADEFELNGGDIASHTFGQGDGGSIMVEARAVRLRNGGEIATSTNQGAAGAIIVKAHRLLIDASGGFQTGISSFAGRSGIPSSLHIVAGTFKLQDGGLIISETRGRGNAGAITVKADRLLIQNGFFENNTDGRGDAGTITIAARHIELRGGEINSNTFGRGNGGAIRVRADRLLIERLGNFDDPRIASFTSTNGGQAGEVRIVAADLEIQGGIITTSTIGQGNTGDAGMITVKADRLLIRGSPSTLRSGIFSDARAGSSGDAGLVQIAAGALQILEGGEISSATFGAGDAGTVTVEVDRLLIRGAASSISSGVVTSEFGEVGQGAAGSVRIRADMVEIADGGSISSSADGPGQAGDVIIAADRLTLDNGFVDTETLVAGGGEIQLVVDDVIVLEDHSAVTTTVRGGADPTAGNILIDSKVLVIDGSVIQANAPEGSGGNLTIVADNILVPGGDFEALLERGEISATGDTPERAGTVAVNAPEVDLSGGLVVLEGALLDVASQLRARCGARRDIGTSSFTGVGRGGLPPGPDGPLGGSYAVAGTGEAGRAAGPAMADAAFGASSERRQEVPTAEVATLLPCRGFF